MQLHKRSRANVLGVGVSAINMDEAVDLISAALVAGRKGYVCVTGVHGVMEAQKDAGFRRILNNSFLTTPDGMPTVWVGRWYGKSQMARVYGPDLMLEVCAASVSRRYKHFLYGGGPGTAESLKASLEAKVPGVNVVGTYTPPFRPLDREEQQKVVQTIAKLKPDIIWVGLSTPKQERFMADFLPRLDTTLMIGVGAAFDIHTGNLQDAPQWVKSLGLQWMHRLIQEPRRLWKRYLINNPLFLYKIAFQLLGFKNYSLSCEYTNSGTFWSSSQTH